MAFFSHRMIGGLFAAAAIAAASQQASAVAMSVNVARQGTATQNSTLANSANPTAFKAIDGGLGTSFNGDATTTHTNGEANSFWQVNLGSTKELTSVELYNRGDCCPERLGNFRLSVLDAGMTEVFGMNVAGSVPSTSQVFALPSGVSGQFVKVQLNGLNNGGNGVLSLREVVIMGEANVVNSSNLARLYGTAKQSSTVSDPGAPGAHRAIDGNTSGVFTSVEATQTVTQTNNVVGSSWEVDLNSAFHIDNVVLFNRSTNTTRLSNFTLNVFDDNHNLVTSVNNPGAIGATGYLAIAPGTVGRFVEIKLNGPGASGENILALAEVQVFGGGLQNIARNPGALATQSSTRVGGGGNAAGFAVDGITNGIFNDGSVTHTNTETDPFWSLVFGDDYDVNEIVLFNRTDCCTERLSGAQIRLFDVAGQQVFLHTLGSTTGQSMLRIAAGDLRAASLQILLPGANRVLSLAEVQVFGQLSIPEPATLSAMLMGLGGLALRRRRAA
ncbi:MAG: discoidin domain-containing protein [Phycisphaeraceae bacterium]